jgi:hypothetical protein
VEKEVELIENGLSLLRLVLNGLSELGDILVRLLNERLQISGPYAMVIEEFARCLLVSWAEFLVGQTEESIESLYELCRVCGLGGLNEFRVGLRIKHVIQRFEWGFLSGVEGQPSSAIRRRP